MTITREQIADLRVGDVVEVRHESHPLVVTRGPVHDVGSDFFELGRFAIVNGQDWTLTVIERAPRPLYVNHPRAEPVPGDVVRDEGDPTTWCFFMSGTRHGTWMSNKAVFTASAYMPKRLRLLVDGETGQVVL